MGKCKDCKMWKSYDSKKGNCDGVGEESLTGFYIRVEVLDDSGLMTELRTGAEFGCTRFVPK